MGPPCADQAPAANCSEGPCNTVSGAALRDCAAIEPETTAAAIAITLDSTFIRSCEDGERHLEVQVGNVETETGGRQVFGAIVRSETDIAVLIRCNLNAVGRTEGDWLKIGGIGARRLFLASGV